LDGINKKCLTRIYTNYTNFKLLIISILYIFLNKIIGEIGDNSCLKCPVQSPIIIEAYLLKTNEGHGFRNEENRFEF
jgi:hypothetical protein